MTASLRRLAVLFTVWSAIGSDQITAVASDYFEGDGTAYTLDPPSAGNCNFMHYPREAVTNYAALNNDQWLGLKNCGRCAEVTCADPSCEGRKLSTELVYIVDRCPECKHGDLDLSPEVFKRVTGSSPSRLRVKWKFVDCPVRGNIQICLKGGSNSFWTAIQPANMVAGVHSMEINGQSTTMVDSAYYYLLDGKSEAQTDLSSVRVRLTSVSGEVVEETVSLEAGACTEGTQQFSRGSPVSPTDTQVPKLPVETAPPTTAPPPAPTVRVSEPPVVIDDEPAPTSQTPPPAEENEIGGEHEDLSDLTHSPVATEAVSTDFALGSASEEGLQLGSKGEATDTGSNSHQPKAESEDAGLRPGIPLTNGPTPSTTPTEGDESKQPAQDADREANTQSSADSGGTSPMIIILACIAGAGTIAVVVMAVITKRKQLDDKRNDRRDDSYMVRSFESMKSPAQAIEATV